MKTLREIQDYIADTTLATLVSQAAEYQNIPQKKPISIYFLNNFTIQPIDPILKIYLHESNLNPKLVFGNYDNVQQEIFDETSSLYAQRFDLIVCSLFHFPTDPIFLKKLDNVNLFINDLKVTFDALIEKTTALILINTFLLPLIAYENITPLPGKPSHVEAINEVNTFIRAYTRQHPGRCFIMDWEQHLRTLGEQNSFDYRYRYLYQAPFKKMFLSAYASDITRVARALNGYAKKCVVLDCDNTLWGGVIGEDGLTGIKLNSYDYPGKVFYDFQYTLLALAERGIILTLASKNNAEDVWEVFEKHPHSLLRRHHFAAARINWENKATNIIEMIGELNISLDSCVFIDDSPTECEWVKNLVPEITVLQVPNAPHEFYQYPTLLLREGLFDSLTINKEDIQRNLLYRTEAERKEVFKQAKDIDSYLASLELKVHIHFMKEDEIPRVAQLTQKTNQFNLSTHRYTSQQITEFYQSHNYAVMSLHVEDKFGHYGLTGVLIAQKTTNSCVIDTLLLSCRILSRNIEYLFLEHCIKQLSKQWGPRLWEAEYIPSQKNTQISDFLTKFGFKKNESNLYSLNLDDWHSAKVSNIMVIAEELEHCQ